MTAATATGAAAITSALTKDGPRRTIVRVLPHPSYEGAFYVEDWQQRDGYAQFTVPPDHPIAIHLKPHREQAMLAVASTAEVEWVVRSISWARWTGVCQVSLTSRANWAKESLLSDEYLEWMGVVS
ncbi:hypothetical protein [Arthrobacter sp. SLBN-53]|uniref:hypothetical protein n=1 Tax=Arthrobacter sp. SLBN-53 TaxID=2768412 RepID=UPI001152CBF5|nr:hypothetical protein [Arthrobacter sp. SLBN-53]TQK29406.1 hypothetical protein FBY28_2409 [Arthrobacter sp. SLBN-53]